MGTMNKLTKIVLSFLMVITCINFSTVQAEDGEEVNYSEPTTVETVSEDPANEVEQEVAQEEPAVEEETTVEEAPAEQPAEEAAPVEEPQQEEVAPEASEEAQVEEATATPEEAASEETTEAAEPQQEETTATPEEQQEVQYPAFNATIEEQGVTLSASEGVFPEGTTVSATDKSDDDAVVNALEATISAANGENLQATGFVAYDFSFVDASGNKVEPKGDVSVTYSNISTTIPSSEVYRVYHVTDDGNVEAVEDSKVTVSDDQVTFTANSFSSYAVVGYNTIQAAVNAEGTENSDANTSEDNIALAATGTEYNIYHYALIPGKSINDTKKADDNWFGLGVTAVTGAKNPKYLDYGTQTNFTYTSSREVKELFPDITYGGKTYKYAASGSGNEDKEGYYTLMPARVVVADGANAGNNAYNPTASGKTYHKDYTMVMNEQNIYTVTFNVQDPGETTFGVLNKYSQRVSAGTSSSNLKQPTSEDVPATKYDVAGNKYTFAGWYTDENCTISADFTNGTVQKNTNYYGKYVAETYTVKYDTNGGNETYDAQTLKYNDVVDTSFTPTRKGYIFAGWYYGKTNASGQKYAALAKSEETKEITLKAKWNEKKISDYLTIEGQNYTGKYDGNSHEVAIPTVTPKGEAKLGNLTYEYSVDGTTWTTDNSKITATNVSDSKDVEVRVISDEYVGTLKTTESLTVTPRQIELTSADAEKVYDGAALTNDKVEVTGDGFAKDEGATYNVTGTITNFGSTDNTFTYTLNEGTKAGNYKITPAYGTLKVTPVTDKVTVTITENSGTEKYDGTEKSVTGYTVKSISNTLYTANDFTFSGTAEAKGTDAGTYDMDVKASDFTNISSNFTNVEFVIENGTLTIEKRNVTLTSEGGSKPYDGKPLTKPNVKVSGDGFVRGEVTKIVASGSVTNVSEGEVSNAIGYSTSETFKNGNYNIVTKIGKLKITPLTDKVTVKITGNSATEEYDGTVKKVTGYTVTNISNKLYTAEAFTFSGTAEAKGTDAGTYDMGLLPGNFKNNSENFTDVTFEVTDGHLTINPKSIVPDKPNTEKTGIEVTKPDDSKYDGKLHQNKPTVIDAKTKATLVEGTDYELSYTSAINAGTVTVTITGKGNYEGSTQTTYEITKRNVTLTSATDSKIYDKTALTNNTVTVSGDKFAEGEGATYNFTGSQTNVGKSDNEFTYTLDKGTKAGNYNIEVKYGELTVTTQDGEVIVVITGHKDEFEYDGTEKSVSGYDVSITKGSTYTTDDFTFSGNSEVKGTDANTYPMGLTAENFTNNNENYTKVRFIVNDGEMTITPKSIIPDEPNAPEVKTGITVTKPSDTMYNGGEQKNKPTVSDSKIDATLEEGKDYELSYSADVTNVGKVTVTITGKGNYKGSTETSYEITKRNVKLTSASDSKIYDGTPLTRPDVTVEGDGFVEGEVSDIKATGSVTNVSEGEVKNEITYTTGANFRNTNYTIEKFEGTLTIVNQSIDPGEDPENPNPYYVGITINAPENQLYDGKKHLWIPEVLDKDGKPLTIGTDYTIAYTDVEGNLKTDFTNVTGMIYVTISGKGNYTGTVTRTYEITKRNVVLTSATDSKKFDGTPLRNENVEVTGEGFAEGEGATYSEFAEVTNVTNEAVANTFTYTLNENTLASNYNISTELGTLTITPKTITPDQPGTPEEEKTGITVENPGDVKYDGKDHAEKPVIKDEKTGVTLEEGKDYEIVYPEDIKNAGEITATVVGKGDYDGSFEIKFNILKRDVTFTSATDSKQYDGNALTNGNVEITGDGFIEGEGATFNVTGSITDVGSTNNAFTYAMNEGTNADNYNVTVVEGTLTVSEQPVVPTPVTPTTPSNNTPARTNNVPARAVTNPTTTTPAPEATVEPEKAETTPAPTAKPEKIKEEATPQAAVKGHWALINLIAAMLSVVLAVVALLAKHAKDEDEDDEDKDDQVVANENEDDDENESTRHRRWKVIATIDAILAVVVFILTENISLPMVLVDKWTLLMVLFGLISIVSTYFARKWHEEDEDEDEESSQNA